MYVCIYVYKERETHRERKSEIHTYIYIYEHVYTYLYTCIYIYIYIYMYVCMCIKRERPTERERDVYIHIYIWTSQLTFSDKWYIPQSCTQRMWVRLPVLSHSHCRVWQYVCIFSVYIYIHTCIRFATCACPTWTMRPSPLRPMSDTQMGFVLAFDW